MGGKRILGALCLVIAFFVMAAGPGAVAEEGAAKPTATVKLSGPAELLVPAEASSEVQIHVASRLECHQGFEPPMDLQVSPAKTSDSLYRIDPATTTVAWALSTTEKNVYVIDELVSFNVTSRTTPDAPTEAEAVLLVKETKEASPRLRCQVEGYSLTFEDHEMSVIVLPEDGGALADAAELDDEPPVQWVPMLLAVSILGALALFASVREKRRRSE